MGGPTKGQRDKNSQLKELKVISRPVTIATEVKIKITKTITTMYYFQHTILVHFFYVKELPDITMM